MNYLITNIKILITLINLKFIQTRLEVCPERKIR